MPKIKTALISVFDKKGIVEFATGLRDLNIDILSTGGTARIIQQAGIPVTDVSEYTGTPSMLGGRVKTLHPRIHGAILALRNEPSHLEEAKKYNLKLIDMVVINLYPFPEIMKKTEISLKEALENIDIGGPTMLRSAAKNFRYVAAVSHPRQYLSLLEELKSSNGLLSEKTCQKLARETFECTSAYDSLISHYLENLDKVEFPEILNLSFKRSTLLKYGENPHQKAALYQEWITGKNDLPSAEKLSGGEVSFNNLLDLEAALRIVREFSSPAAVIIKHNNPCGAAVGNTLAEAFKKAYQGDPISAFGSIAGFNKTVDPATARAMSIPKSFVEAIIAPGFEKDSLEIIREGPTWGKRVIIMQTGPFTQEITRKNTRSIPGGLLVQEEDQEDNIPKSLKVVSHQEPSKEELKDLLFAWTICKHVKSNAIVLVKNGAVVGVGAGQMSRVDSTLIALRKAGERRKNSVLASDAFFPFADAIEEAGKAGVSAIIQPGGSKRDAEVIEAVNHLGIAMVFTGKRHFRH